MFTKLKERLNGRKAYLICVAAITGALLAWLEGQIDTQGMITAIVAALYGIMLRLGVTKSGPNNGK